MEIVCIKLVKTLTEEYPECAYCLARVHFIESEPYIADQLVQMADLLAHVLNDHKLTEEEIFEHTGNFICIRGKRKR
jgi:saccharopine dehydrogenase-like NADP-dependent oxidoreductase